MVWCPIITAQYVIVREVAGRPLDERARAGLRRHFEVTRTPEGGWGLHRESSSYVFVTALAYVALRLLGLSAAEPMLKDARALARAAAGWGAGHSDLGKFWLALLDLYDWRGVNPIPPEMFLLPPRFPFTRSGSTATRASSTSAWRARGTPHARFAGPAHRGLARRALRRPLRDD